MAEPTTYTVLHRAANNNAADEAELWSPIGNAAAANPAAAIRLVLDQAAANPADGSYVAVPMRSWKPLQVTATTQTVLKIT